MARLRNIGTKVQSLTLPPAREVTLQPGEEISGAPVYMALKLQEGNDFAVEWEPEEVKDRDKSGQRAYATFRSPFSSFDGYGIIGINTLINAARYGLHLTVQQPELSQARFASTMNALEQHYPEAYRLIHRPDRHPTKWGLVHAIPPDLQWMKTEKRVLWSMFEALALPTDFQGVDWAHWARQADAIIVPSSGQVEVFRNSGCQQDIHVVPDGMECDTFQLLDRPTDRDTFTFFTFGRLSARKAPFKLLHAFVEAFQGVDDVRLVIKTRDNLLGMIPIPEIKDKRITVINENWSRAQLLDAMYNADAAVFGTFGEGFGNPPLQAALTGLPTVACRHSGCTDWCLPEYFYSVDLDKNQPYVDSSLGTKDGKTLQWWNPDWEQFAQQMRYVYNNREKARRKAKKASTWIRKNFSVDSMMTRLTEVLTALD